MRAYLFPLVIGLGCYPEERNARLEKVRIRDFGVISCLGLAK